MYAGRNGSKYPARSVPFRTLGCLFRFVQPGVWRTCQATSTPCRPLALYYDELCLGGSHLRTRPKPLTFFPNFVFCREPRTEGPHQLEPGSPRVPYFPPSFFPWQKRSTAPNPSIPFSTHLLTAFRPFRNNNSSNNSRILLPVTSPEPESAPFGLKSHRTKKREARDSALEYLSLPRQPTKHNDRESALCSTVIPKPDRPLLPTSRPRGPRHRSPAHIQPPPPRMPHHYIVSARPQH